MWDRQTSRFPVDLLTMSVESRNSVARLVSKNKTNSDNNDNNNKNNKNKKAKQQ